jgi:hypothetical protein
LRASIKASTFRFSYNPHSVKNENVPLMKTKLYVAGISGCLLLLIAIYQPFVRFTSKSVAQSTEDLTAGRSVLNYEEAAIPGLEVKTPAKVAIVNKAEVAGIRKNPKKVKTILAKTQPKEKTISDLEPVAKKSEEIIAGLLKKEADQDNLHPYVASSKTVSRRVKNKPPRPEIEIPEEVLVNASPNRSGRTVINYDNEETVVNTSYKTEADKTVNTSKDRFPHGNEAADEVRIESGEENVVAVAKVEKKEKTYSFRGKTEVKSSLYKYIPPFWDGFSPEIGNESADRTDVIQKAKKLAAMANKGGYNNEYAFLLDMSVKSNKYRFFIVNLKTMRIEKSALVAQGRGKQNLNLDKEYSNTPGSNCSSLGVYKVGKSYNGDFGLSYRLHGLESSNSNALKRYIVLHAMGTVPDMETNFPIWQSEGCPSVAPKVLEKLSDMIDNSKKPILMWMYDDTFIPMM